MEKEINWKRLLSGTRERQPMTQSDSNRNPFDCDYDRIVGSSSVRRLQDKAQVFPLQDNDFTRTRLTHSMEVSAMARSFGKQIGRWIEEKDSTFTRERTEELEAMLQTAGLIHDLGNPPFGHYGEAVIRNWFESAFENMELLKDMDENRRKEFIFFDGNVQNLRIVSKLQMLNDQYGANFTYGTLATIMKYPWDASEANKDNAKFGFYETEKSLVDKVYSDIGLEIRKRHPAVYLMEASDDIIYIGDDIEDGVKKGCIDWEEAYKDLKEHFGKEHQSFFEKFEEKKKIINRSLDATEQVVTMVRYFRNMIQGYLMGIAIEEFKTHYHEIMSCTYARKELLDVQKDFVRGLKGITAKYCFSSREVLALELVGDKVISGLLDIFVPALIKADNSELTESKSYAGKLYHIISGNFKYIALFDYYEEKEKNIQNLTKYDKLHLIVDFISGMTDSYALNLYKELSGIKIAYQ